jgi:hypothetical protein
MVYGGSTCCHAWQWCADADGHPHPEQGPGVNIRVRSPRPDVWFKYMHAMKMELIGSTAVHVRSSLGTVALVVALAE